MSDILEIPVSEANDPDGVGLSAILQLNFRREAARQRLIMFMAALALVSIPIAAILATVGSQGAAGFVLSRWGFVFLSMWVTAFVGAVLQGRQTFALEARLEDLSRRAGARWIETTV